MNKHLVFIYGSLRRDCPQSMSIRFPKAQFIADGKVSGRLYDLGAYPGLQLDESGSLVTGEVYEVDDETLSRLDDFEAASNYLRKQAEVSLAKDRRTCWTYGPNPEFYSLSTLVTTGDWVEYTRTKTSRSERASPD